MRNQPGLRPHLVKSLVIHAVIFGLISAAILKTGVLRESWTLLEKEMSQYDAILLAYAAMIVLMVVTLGLVPSVLRKAEWVPQAQ